MTIQTKKFIEIADIVAVRCECKNDQCRASLSLPMLENIAGNRPLAECPNCGKRWLLLEDADHQQKTKTLLRVFREISTATMGCSFTLEIKPESQEVPSLSKRDL